VSVVLAAAAAVRAAADLHEPEAARVSRVAVPAEPVILTSGPLLRAVCLVGGCRRVIGVAASRAELEAEAELHRRAAHSWVKEGRVHRVEEAADGEG
jgi:hypothetical protein